MSLPPDLEKYMDVNVIRGEQGFVVWRLGTGGNAELLWIRSHAKGWGRKLFVMMLKALRENPPYHTVFGFTRFGNWDAMGFYDRMGFSLSKVEGVYKDGVAVVFSAPYEDLCNLHGVGR